MNERLKELARQAKPSPNLIWEDSELERFAELVRQDYLRELKALKPVAWMLPKYGDVLSASQADGTGIYNIPLYTAPPRKPWVGLTNEDWENTPDTGKQGCERDAELFDWVEQTLKDKNT